MRGQQQRLRHFLFVAAAVLVVGEGHAQQVEFRAATAAHGYATRSYQRIWNEHGERIIAALEARTCLPFQEVSVTAVVADRVSHSGGPDHPMRLRASYPIDTKQSTLVHELGHRHLWQLTERLDGVDGHRTLYLILDRVWEDLWGPEFAARRVEGESGWRSRYDYAAAWAWVKSLDAQERARLWRELLAINGMADACTAGGDAT